ncbi:site-specific integrase [Bosea sp. (in: a-proteobacteria)]|uniref:tyrosine-type recombinase/integrase n=1 Tax=Bosea sp. (in: a-proteobacteria) TaxID=1871050 RepID=UPI00260BDA8F|nr:site-specific integrase [Bosea sp. (in: a-proteobacteria)]MCO5089873.1 site-specific integrase [Bosea sp. (in: a-proteobacteria)]
MQADISTAAKRAKLKPRKNPYWTAVSGGRGGVSLGYRRSAKSGTWIAKIVVEGNRSENRLGIVDDGGQVEGALSYRTAAEAALEWSRQQFAALEAGVSKAARQPATVETAVRDYIVARKRKSASSAENATSRLTGHVLADKAFAATRLSKLRASTIEAWRDRVPMKTDAPESKGLAASSVNRLMADLRAALNAAAERRRRELPAHLMQEIRIGTRCLQADSGATMMLLTDAQVRAAVAAAEELDPQFGQLVAAAATTGARFSQLAAVRVGDLQVAQARLVIPSSRKGRAGKARAPVAYPLAPDVVAKLAKAIDGRPASAPLFRRWAFRRGKRLEWIRDRLVPWTAASEAQALWSDVAKSAGLPAGTTMYSLRHSSIVRGLTAGLPVRLVAALHDTSIPMIEKHYSAYIVDATEDLARKGILTL